MAVAQEGDAFAFHIGPHPFGLDEVVFHPGEIPGGRGHVAGGDRGQAAAVVVQRQRHVMQFGIVGDGQAGQGFRIVFKQIEELVIPFDIVEAGARAADLMGQPAGGENSAPLSITLAGKVNHALIIGELGERDRLWGASFYGPEMYTAIRPAKDRIGQAGAPAQFAARFVSVLGKQSDWLQYLQAKKQTNRKIWLELSDCFGR